MPKPVLAVLGPPDHAPVLSATQWYALLPNGHEYFAFPRRLTAPELARMRARYAPWLANLEQYLHDHPFDPHTVSILDMIRHWAEVRHVVLDGDRTQWPGVYAGEEEA